MRAVIPSFVKAIAIGEVVLWTRLLSLRYAGIMFKAEGGRRKGEETHNRFASNESRGLNRPGEILDAQAGLLVVVQPRLSWLDRSIDRRGRSRGGRAKREDSRIEKRIWNL